MPCWQSLDFEFIKTNSKLTKKTTTSYRCNFYLLIVLFAHYCGNKVGRFCPASNDWV